MFNYKKGNIRSNVMLAAIYSFQGMEMMNGTFYRFMDFWVTDFPWVYYSTEFTFFLWGPAIYFFFRFSLDKTSRFEKRDYWHLTPAIIHTCFLCIVFHFNSNETKTLLMKTGVMSPVEDLVIHFLKNLTVVVYLIISTRLFLKAKVDNADKTNWLIFFLIVFWTVEFIQILHFIDLETRIYNTVIYNTTTIVWFSVSVTTLYKVLRDPFFFANEKTSTEELKVEEKRDSVPLDDGEYQFVLTAIQTFVIDENGFVNPELNLKTLSAEIGYPSKKVSYVINDYYKNNISDFINSYRIEKAKELLLKNEEPVKTIIEIAYEVGFNSKPTFNRAFSKFTELTPTEYRKVN